MIPTIPRVRVVLAVLLALGGGFHRPIMTFGGTGSGPFTFQSTSGILVHSAGSTDGSDPSTKRPVIGELMAETGFYQSMTLSSDVEQPLFHTRSQYQDISIVKTDYYGKVLILDGVVQLTERDADSYNEMMAHIAMMATSEPKRVLVVGGGDGYVLSEVSARVAFVFSCCSPCSIFLTPRFRVRYWSASGTFGLVSLREIAHRRHFFTPCDHPSVNTVGI